MTGFKWVVRLRILINLVLSGIMLWVPQELMNFFDLPGGATTQVWIQAAGIFYLYISLGYIPSAFAPSKTKAANLFPLLAPILPIILFFCLGGGFIWLALYELLFLIALHLSFRRGFVSELMALP